MNDKRRIEQAIDVYRQAFADYSKEVKGLTVQSKRPLVTKLPDGKWMIDGVTLTGLAVDIINDYGRRVAELYQKIKERREGMASGATQG